ncbi:MAG: hypothetical protein ABW063_13950 [Caulobacter sp.]
MTYPSTVPGDRAKPRRSAQAPHDKAAGAATHVEKAAREAEPRQIDKSEKAEVAEEASRQSDA